MANSAVSITCCSQVIPTTCPLAMALEEDDAIAIGVDRGTILLSLGLGVAAVHLTSLVASLTADLHNTN